MLAERNSLVFGGVCIGLLIFTLFAHVFLTPFTKVEESFNLQALHDLCYFRHAVSKYDHQVYPGVVPRTFVGAIFAALPTCPILSVLERVERRQLWGLYVARLVLGSLSCLGLLRLWQAANRQLGKRTGIFLILITCTQFHLPFYASRPLPNTFALPLVCWAAAEFLLNKPDRVIYILAFTSLVIRCDTLPFAALLGLLMLLQHQISFRKAVIVGLKAALLSSMTIPVDSFLWGRPIWPEGAVLWFNTAENRSSEWGTQPFLWYFYSALPRAMLAALPMAVWGLRMEQRLRPLIAAAAIHIALYSLLPHKELRFILPMLPILNLPAAAALASLWQNKQKSRMRNLIFCSAALSLLGNLGATTLFTAVSRHNYPGGHALAKLHHLEVQNGLDGGFVHIDVLPAMTGVSRFGELGPPWKYSKEEDLPLATLQTQNFTHLLSAASEIPGFEVMEVVTGLPRLRTAQSLNELWSCLHSISSPIWIEVRDQVYIHRRALA